MLILFLFGKYTHLGIFPCEKEMAMDVLQEIAYRVLNLRPGNFLKVQ